MSISQYIRKALAGGIRLFGLARRFGLPEKELTVKQYTKQYFATYTPPIQLIVPAATISRTPPIVNTARVNWKFRSLFLVREKSAFILRLEDAKVVGSNGAVITKEQVLLRDVSREFGNRSTHSAFWRLNTTKRSSLIGKSVILTTAGHGTYYHWMTDVIPRFVLLEKSGIKDDIDYFLLPPITTAFQKQTLESLGLHSDRIKEIQPGELVRCEELFVPSLPSELGIVNTWVSDCLSSLFSPALLNDIPKRIFISRRSDYKRSFINEQDLVNLSKEFGFVPLYAEDFSVNQQVAIFSKVEAIIAPHGSGLTNIVFCKEGTIVIDLFPEDFIVPCFWSIAATRNLQYYGLAKESSLDNQYEPYWENVERSGEFPVTILREALNKIFN